LARFDARGRLDPTFGGDGLVTTDLSPAGEQIRDLVLVGRGRVVAAGVVEVGLIPRFGIARYRVDGSLDRGFGKRGARIVSVSGGADSALGVARASDGSLVAVGCAEGRGQLDWGIAVFGSGGDLDSRFAGDGTRVLKLGLGDECAHDAAVLPNGRILVVGLMHRRGTGADFGVVRLKPNGTYNSTFGKNGRALVDFFHRGDVARDVVLQSDGRIVAAGEAVDSGVRRMAVARFLG
jgi:uncharacterized delta-60 repeat protein